MEIFASPPTSTVLAPRHTLAVDGALDREPRPSSRYVEAWIPEPALALKSNPTLPHLVVVGGAQNYGIAGKGSISVCSVPTNNFVNSITAIGPRTLNILGAVYTEHAVQDCCWNESAPLVVAAACGDGKIQLCSLATASNGFPDTLPLQPHTGESLFAATANVSAHRRECSSLDWNAWNRDLLMSCSWDGTASLWQVSGAASIRRLLSVPRLHGGAAVHRVVWHPSEPSVVASSGADGFFQVFDVRMNYQAPRGDPASATTAPAARLFSQSRAHQGEALCVDWNKFFPFVLATSGADATVRFWDIRNAQRPIGANTPHKLGIKQVRWSPHFEHLVATSSFDTTVAVWWGNRLEPSDNGPFARNVSKTPAAGVANVASSLLSPSSRRMWDGTLPQVFSHHREFVSGLDWNLHICGLLGSAGWDGRVAFWDSIEQAGSLPPDLLPR